MVLLYYPFILDGIWHCLTFTDITDFISGTIVIFGMFMGSLKMYELTINQDKIIHIEETLKRMFIEGLEFLFLKYF